MLGTLAVSAWLAAGPAGCSRSAPAGSGDATDVEVLELRYQGSMGVVTLPELAEDLGFLDPIRLKYVGATISGPQDIQTVVTGDTDYGGAFNGAVIKLVAAGAPIKAIVGYYGVDQDAHNGVFVLDGGPLTDARSLIGRKVAMNTVGAHQEFMLREYLARNGLTPEEARQVTLVALPPLTTEKALRQGQVEAATLSNMFRDVAVDHGGIHELFSDLALFGEFTAGTYVMTNQFRKRNPNTTRKFVEAVARAVDWTKSRPRSEVVARFEQIVGKRNRSEDAATVRYWKSSGVAGKGGLISDRDFQMWLDWLVKDGQIAPGQVKLSDVHTNEFNPFASDSKLGANLAP